MKILILGGTKFLGRHLVEAALSRDHQVTLFNRGTTNPGLFPDVEKLRGDRDGNLDALKARCWDAVIDTCGYTPAQVQATARLLADATSHYTFISSISVYHDFSQAGQDESARVAAIPPGVDADLNDGEHYGAKKALCEQAAERAMPGRVLVIRPGIITGPHDFTKRFARWILRTAHGGAMLCPAPPEAPFQIIDARDLSQWTMRMIESGTTGCFNATGPAIPLTFQQMLEQCKTVSSSNARFVWMDADFLLLYEVKPLSDLPLWIPQGEKDYAGFFAVNCQRAVHAGLNFRPLADTVRDILNHERVSANDLKTPSLPGLSRERESNLFRAWKAFATQDHEG